jgi:hypothetical protein
LSPYKITVDKIIDASYEIKNNWNEYHENMIKLQKISEFSGGGAKEAARVINR